MRENLSFWAKTYPAGDTAASAYKPVLHHLLDVAAVAASYLKLQNGRLAREASLCDIAREDYPALAAFLAGLHDIGKFSRYFQAQVETLWPTTLLGARPNAIPPGKSHWRATGLLLQLDPLRAALTTLLPDVELGRRALVAAIAGHHGRPPPQDDDAKAAGVVLQKAQWFDAVCLNAAASAFAELSRLTGVRSVRSLNDDNTPLFSWRLSGLITLADWVGSDAEYFPPRPLDTPLDDYWREAQSAAEQALAAKSLAPLAAAPASLAHIAPHAAAAPRPMQLFAQEIPIDPGPQLILIEDTTGSGKTEAALLLAARMIGTGLGEGIYFALPTMATANAMHRRLDAVAPRLFAPDARAPSVVLSHGKAAIDQALAHLTAEASGNGEASTAASCNAWIADDRRRAFFADVGAGTIDQAFLTVLPKKHLTLRQYALAGRILIVDEAHCFDAYMKEELGALLRLHAMNGGSAIVLSATLSLSARRQMAHSFYEGVSFDRKYAKRMKERCAPGKYPLLTHLTGKALAEHACAFDSRLARNVAVQRIEDRAAALLAALEAAAQNAAVLVVCNAVDEAIAVYEKLIAAKRNETVHLFHARFAQGDRIAIEDTVLARFGRTADPEHRAGHILVATQVVEQSLDLDFDLVISDLAPIDLLIQRAGRLWRHMDIRPAASRAVPQPKLLVVSGDPSSACESDWLAPSLGKSAYVYQNAGIMWRTAREIFAHGKISTPGDFRPLIEAVYGESKEAVPQGLEVAEMQGLGKDGKARALGAFNVIDFERGYGALPSDLRADEDIGTRLGEPTVTLRLARRENGALVPWIGAGGDIGLAWALSELRVRAALWQDASPLVEDKALHAAVRQSWSEWEQSIALAEVEGDGTLRVERVGFAYSPDCGLRHYPE